MTALQILHNFGGWVSLAQPPPTEFWRTLVRALYCACRNNSIQLISSLQVICVTAARLINDIGAYISSLCLSMILLCVQLALEMKEWIGSLKD
jgi:hypothetical protein